MRRPRPVIRRLFLVLIGCILLLPSHSGFAQQNDNPGLDHMLDVYNHATNGWIDQVLTYANDLFLLLAGIEFAWTATILLLEQQSLEGWVAAFIRKLMWISFFYAVMINAKVWIPAIIDSFTQIGQKVGGTRNLTPDQILVDGMGMALQIIEAASKIKPNAVNPLENGAWLLLFVSISIVIVVCYIAMALTFVMTQVEGYIVISAGMIYLGFGGSRWTSSYTERFFNTAVTTGIRLMTFFLIIGLGLALANATWNPATTDIVTAINRQDFRTAAGLAFNLGAGVIIFAVLALRLPRIAGGVISGSAGLSAGDVAGTMSSFAGVGASALGLAAAPALAGIKVGAAVAKAGRGMAADLAGSALSRFSTGRGSGGVAEMGRGPGLGVSPPVSHSLSGGQGNRGSASPGFNDAVTEVNPPPPSTALPPASNEAKPDVGSTPSDGQGTAGGASQTASGNSAMMSPNSFVSTVDVGQPPALSSGQGGTGGSFMDGVQKTAAAVSSRIQEIEKGLVTLLSDPQSTPDTSPPPPGSDRG